MTLNRTADLSHHHAYRSVHGGSIIKVQRLVRFGSVFNIFKQRLTKNKKALQSSNVIKLRKEPSSEMDLALFYKKIEEFLKKWLTKRQKCAGDFISKLIKSPLVNSGKFAIDKEKSNDLHP